MTHVRCLVCAAAFAALVVSISGADADITYSYDHGTTGAAVGPPSSFPQDPVTGWGNYFITQPAGEVITSMPNTDK